VATAARSTTVWFLKKILENVMNQLMRFVKEFAALALSASLCPVQVLAANATNTAWSQQGWSPTERDQYHYVPGIVWVP
jgi:hypothetical protein